jgi:hypothetical protein
MKRYLPEIIVAVVLAFFGAALVYMLDMDRPGTTQVDAAAFSVTQAQAQLAAMKAKPDMKVIDGIWEETAALLTVCGIKISVSLSEDELRAQAPGMVRWTASLTGPTRRLLGCLREVAAQQPIALSSLAISGDTAAAEIYVYGRMAPIQINPEAPTT